MSKPGLKDLRVMLAQVDSAIEIEQRAIKERYQAQRESLIAQIVKLEREQFEQETGLKSGDELEITLEFVQFENNRDNDGSYWITGYLKYGKPLILSDFIDSYFSKRKLHVCMGGTCVGGVPVEMVQRMRQAWLDQHPAHVDPA